MLQERAALLYPQQRLSPELLAPLAQGIRARDFYSQDGGSIPSWRTLDVEYMSRINERPPGKGKKGSKVRRALRRRDGDLCWICGAEMDFDAPAGRTPLSATRDHIIERRGGGRDNLANQRLAHAKCNNDRSARVPGGAPKKRVFLRLQFGDFEVILVKRYH